MRMAGYTINARTLIKWLVALLVTIVIAIFWEFPLAATFGLFAVAFLLDIDPAVPLAVALIILVVCALLVLLSQQEAAKMLAMWSFCFLAIGITLQFYHYIMRKPEDDEDSDV